MVLPDVVSLQVSDETRYRWIDYSSLDAQATWLLRESLECKLRNMPVEACRYLSANEHFKVCATMWDFYTQNWLPFGEILVDMERNGMLVDREQLRVAETLATEHQQTSEDSFRNWAIQRCEDARYMNVGSGAQVRLPQPCQRAAASVTDTPGFHTGSAAAVCWP
jgi:DNA polymerase-1